MNQEVILLILGWLFGILTSPIVKSIEHINRKRDILDVLRSELDGLKTRMAGTYLALDMHLEAGSEDSFEKMRTILNASTDLFYAELKTGFKKISYEDYKKAPRPTHLSKNLKGFTLPITVGILGDLPLLEASVQKDVLWIIERIEMLNGEIKGSTQQYNLTFQPDVMKVNQKIINANIDASYAHIRSQVEDLVDRLNILLEKIG